MASDVQAQLGHADASTTMRYALAGDAMERRKRFRTRWER
jgi:integrase